MATDEQLKSYTESLPPIYREILAAFPRIAPSRGPGYGQTYQTLEVDLESYSFGEIIQACKLLEQRDIVEIKHTNFVCPTELGERLIGIITGQSALEVRVPELPALPT